MSSQRRTGYSPSSCLLCSGHSQREALLFFVGLRWLSSDAASELYLIAKTSEWSRGLEQRPLQHSCEVFLFLFLQAQAEIPPWQANTSLELTSQNVERGVCCGFDVQQRDRSYATPGLSSADEVCGQGRCKSLKRQCDSCGVSVFDLSANKPLDRCP